MKQARPLIALVVVLAGFVFIPASAQAAAIFKYGVSIDQLGVSNPLVGGTINVAGLDTSKDTNMIVIPPSGPNRFTGTQPAAPGNNSYNVSGIAGLSPGDTIVVRQPAASVLPTESYVIPALSLTTVVGSSVVTGNMPAGLVGAVVGDYRCDLNQPAQNVGAGAFSVPVARILPGDDFQVTAFSAAGDQTYLATGPGGETPCIHVSAAGHVAGTPGAPADPTPYHVDVSHLIQSIAPSVRVVIHRGATVLTDASSNTTYVSNDFAAMPLPGDTVDVYRPKTAPAPTFSATVPQVSSVFDPTVDQVSVDAPAAGEIYASPCRAFGCVTENIRAKRDTPAGRTFLDFSKSEGVNSAVDLRPDDYVFSEFVSPDNLLEFDVKASPGDLVPPVQSFKLPTKLKPSALIKLLKKGYKIKLTSNEAGTAKLSLGKLASVSKPIKAGTNTLTLKFSKSGKKQLKKLAAKGKRAKPLSVTLTSVVTDASGNAATLTKKTRIKP